MKASEILLDESIPHGTKEGYAQGCHGSHCPGKESEIGMSCSQASIRYASDYSYKRRIDGGLSPEAIAAEDKLEGYSAPTAATRRADMQSVPTVTVADSETSIEKDVDEDEPVKAAAIAHAETTGIPYEKHGTTAGYSAGCRDKTGCPGIERVYKSCTQAASEYQREYSARRKAAAQGLEPAKPKPAAPEAADQVVEAAVERRVDGVAAELHQAQIDIRELTRQRDDAAAQSDALLEAQAGHIGRINELESLLSDKDAQLLDERQDHARVAAGLQERVTAKDLELDVVKAELADAKAAHGSCSYDWQQLWLANERLRADAKVDAAIERLEPALADVVPARAPGGAMGFAIEQNGGSVRVQLDGSSEPMRLELGFENGQLQRAAVVTGA